MHTVYVCWTIVVKRVSDSEELSYSGQTICNFNRTSSFTTDILFFFASTDILPSVLKCYNCYEHFFRALPSDFPIHSRTLYTHTLIPVSLADKHLVFLWLFIILGVFYLERHNLCTFYRNNTVLRVFKTA